MNNDVHGGHRERLRQRLMTEGADNFEPHELLEFLLYYAIPRQNVNLLAHELLNRFGTVRSVLSAEVDELKQVKGMGDNAAQWLRRVGECTDACGRVEPKGFLPMTTARVIMEDLKRLDLRPEAPCMMQLCLNRESALLYRRFVCFSRRWGEPDVLRDAIRDVFSTGAQGVVIVLFVNDNPLEPTEYDLQKVQDYACALNTADSALLDLLMIREKSCCSLRRLGHIPDLKFSDHARIMCERYLSDFPADIYSPLGGYEPDEPV